MTSTSHQGKAWPPNTPGIREAEDDIQQQTPTPKKNTQELGEQMHGSNEATQRHPQRQTSPASNYHFFERHERQYHTHRLQSLACCQTLHREY